MKRAPGIEKFGPLFKACEPIDLTEPETEYRVRCVKHVFPRHLILQFECLNTLSDQVLEKVYVRLDTYSDYKVVGEVSCDQLEYDKQGSVYCILQFPENSIRSLVTFAATLVFVVHDCDPITGLPDSSEGYADTYSLEDIEIGCAEQFCFGVASDDWEATWEKAFTATEACDAFRLAETDIGKAANVICEYFGLPKSAISGDTVKEIRGGGLWRCDVPVLIRARLVASQGVVTMHFAVRSPREDVAKLLLAAIR